MALRMVRYKLQTLTLVGFEARATGGGSPCSVDSGGVIKGRSVVRASGRRRVKKRVEAWRYVLDICEGWRDAVDDERDDIDESMLGAKGLEMTVEEYAGLCGGKEPLVEDMAAGREAFEA